MEKSMERGCGSEEDSQRMPFDQALAFYCYERQNGYQNSLVWWKGSVKAAWIVFWRKVQSPINVPDMKIRQWMVMLFAILTW